MSSIGDITLDIKIGGDTKSLDATISKVKSLDAAISNLNKNLKNTDSGLKFKSSSSVSSVAGQVRSPKDKTDLQIAREKLNFSKVELGNRKIAMQNSKIDYFYQNKERKEKEKEEKENKKRRKEAQKANEKFFSTIRSGFATLGKIAIGSVGGIAGLIGAGKFASSQATSISNLNAQQGIASGDLQRWRNILTQANPALGGEDAIGIIGNLQSKLAANALTGELVGPLSQLGLNPGERSAIKVLQSIRDQSNFISPDIFSSLLGGLGIDPAAANALNKSKFSDADFAKAGNIPINSQKTIDANVKLAKSINELGIAFDNLKAKILAEISPTLTKAIDTVLHPEGKEKEISEAKKKALIIGGIAAAGTLFLTKSPVAAAAVGSAVGGYFGVKSLGKSDEERDAEKEAEEKTKKEINGLVEANIRRMTFQEGAWLNGKPMTREQMEDARNFARAEYDSDPKKYKAFDESTTIDWGKNNKSGTITNNNSVVTNINAGEINKNDIPKIARSIENSGKKVHSTYNIQKGGF